MFELVKLNKRLCVRLQSTGEVVYTPPDFLRPYIRNRDGMNALVTKFDTAECPDIGAIMEFEASVPRR